MVPMDAPPRRNSCRFKRASSGRARHSSPSASLIRVFISAALAREKVTTSSSSTSQGAFSSVRRPIIRCTSTAVLPLPAAALTARDPPLQRWPQPVPLSTA